MQFIKERYYKKNILDILVLVSPVMIKACGQDSALKIKKSDELNTQETIIDAAATGSNKGTSGPQDNIDIELGVPGSYNSPSPTYSEAPSSNKRTPKITGNEVDPYWVNSLLFDEYDIQKARVESDGNKIFYAFPETIPSYLSSTIDITGWTEASADIKSASESIFNYLNKVLNVRFEITEDINRQNVIAISQNDQNKSAGYAYSPSNNLYPIGSDIFISNEYAKPKLIGAGTNYDFETLLHEISHALGLKHSFESLGANDFTLPLEEENRNNTVMSYTGDLEIYPAKLRDFDIFALTKIYGLNKNIKIGDDLYKFSNTEGIMIFDAGGSDTIDASHTNKNLYLDLRPAAHSFLEEKSELITDPYQMSISYGSEIEFVLGSTGENIIIGNSADNNIKTQNGNDKIFAGEGADIINSGSGIDIVDLAEEIGNKDTVIIETGEGYKTIYGFDQSDNPDVIFLQTGAKRFEFSPLIDDSVPIFLADNLIVPLVGKDYFLGIKDPITTIAETFLPFKILNECFLIYADTQDTGKDQYLYNLSNENNKLNADLLAIFSGNYLDIDLWGVENFQNSILI